jgi:hypothetical protein
MVRGVAKLKRENRREKRTTEGVRFIRAFYATTAEALTFPA